MPGPERVRELPGVPASEKAPRLAERLAALSRSSRKEYHWGIGSDMLAVSSELTHTGVESCGAELCRVKHVATLSLMDANKSWDPAV